MFDQVEGVLKVFCFVFLTTRAFNNDYKTVYVRCHTDVLDLQVHIIWKHRVWTGTRDSSRFGMMIQKTENNYLKKKL